MEKRKYRMQNDEQSRMLREGGRYFSSSIQTAKVTHPVTTVMLLCKANSQRQISSDSLAASRRLCSRCTYMATCFRVA